MIAADAKGTRLVVVDTNKTQVVKNNKKKLNLTQKILKPLNCLFTKQLKKLLKLNYFFNLTCLDVKNHL